MRRLVLAAALVCVALTAAGQTPPPANPANKEQRVRKLLVLMRAGNIGVQIVDQMIASLKESLPDAPDAFWTGFRSKVKSEEMVEMLVPIYMKHLDAADIEELIRFYDSPTGQRFLDKQPLMMRESMMVGQEWGQRIAKEAFDELQKTEKQEL